MGDIVRTIKNILLKLQVAASKKNNREFRRLLETLSDEIAKSTKSLSKK